jgi:hypothetical protein
MGRALLPVNSQQGAVWDGHSSRAQRAGFHVFAHAR